jgi:hypothetical protein
MCDRSQLAEEAKAHAKAFADALEQLLDDFDPTEFMLNSFRAEHGREPRSDDEFLRFSEAALAKMKDAVSQQPNPADVAYAIDNFRAQIDQLQQPQQPAPEQSQPTVEPPQDGIDPEIAQALANPKIRSAIEAELQQTTAERQQYATAAKEAVTLAMAGVVANFPELGNIPIPHLQSAIQVIAKTNPQRAAAMTSALERTQVLLDVSQKAQAAQREVRSKQFQQYVESQDAKFEAYVKAENPETVRKVKDSVGEVLAEYGIGKHDLRQLWQSEPLMRSAEFQKMLYDLTRFKIAARDVQTKVAPKVLPPVQRPGVSRPADNGEDVTAAMRRFNANPSPKNAADVLLARRAAKR